MTRQQLIKGKTYWHRPYLTLYTKEGSYLSSNGGFTSTGFSHYSDDGYEEATPEEALWLEYCINLGEYIPFEKMIKKQIYEIY